MSGQGPPRSPGGAPGEGGGDPSMEDILASIRRILSEDDVSQSGTDAVAQDMPPTPASYPTIAAPPPPSEVLALDSSMLVEEPPAPAARSEVLPMPGPDRLPSLHADRAIDTPPTAPISPPSPPIAASEDRIDMPAPPEPFHEPSQPAAPAPSGPLVAPEAAAAAASSVGSLLRTIGARQGIGVSRGGPTIEDLVREELRPVLKAWLDANLPPMVERLVRAEIERVVGRADT